jgi:aspartyl protease family protein
MDHRINVPLVAKLVCCLTLFSGPQSVSAIDKLMVLGLFKDKAIVEIDGKRRVLSRGKTTPEGVRLITANSDQAVIEIYGEQGAYKVGTHISSSYVEASPQATVRIWPDAMGMYQVNGSINEFLVKFLVDTGATLVAMNKNQAKRLGLDYKLDGIASRMTTASGIAKAYYLTLKKV